MVVVDIGNLRQKRSVAQTCYINGKRAAMQAMCAQTVPAQTLAGTFIEAPPFLAQRSGLRFEHQN
jgi:hypothetical protein